MDSIAQLLHHTESLLKYERELTNATGEQFNIFEIVKIGSYEVVTHSPFIAELLNPQGRHGMGSCFLKAFTQQLNLSLGTTVTVRLERWVEADLSGRGNRIDIHIKDNENNDLVIENKIYAAYQEKQISRYLSSLPRAKVLYLTLDGDKPEEEITNDRLLCISYKKHILEWLEICRKESAMAPVVRETITQYINLIKTLTNQNTNSRMQDQIVKQILSSESSLDAYIALDQSKEAVITEIFKILRAQLEEIAKSLLLKLDFPKSFSGKLSTFDLYDERMKNKNLKITFQFVSKEDRDFQYGISYFTEIKNRLESEISRQFRKELGPCGPHEWWAAVAHWDERSNWWPHTFRDVVSGKMKEELRARIKILADIARSAC